MASEALQDEVSCFAWDNKSERLGAEKARVAAWGGGGREPGVSAKRLGGGDDDLSWGSRT